MKPFSLEHIIRLQFSALMMIVIKGKLKNQKSKLSKRSKQEVLFCEIPETKQAEHGTTDVYSFDFMSFEVQHFTINVSDEVLGIALHKLSEKQRSAILLFYFQGMNDREISELCHVSRSAISARRNRGLKKLEALLNERK